MSRNWWELPDGTLVRDAGGALRLVTRGKKTVYLQHWSDEYASWYDGALHVLFGCEIDREPVTVVRTVDEPTE